MLFHPTMLFSQIISKQVQKYISVDFSFQQIVQNVKAANILLGKFASVGMFLNNFSCNEAKEVTGFIPKVRSGSSLIAGEGTHITAECVFKQIAIHPDDRENCVIEPNVHEPITIWKHFNVRATEKLITLRKKRRTSL